MYKLRCFLPGYKKFDYNPHQMLGTLQNLLLLRFHIPFELRPWGVCKRQLHENIHLLCGGVHRRLEGPSDSRFRPFAKLRLRALFWTELIEIRATSQHIEHSGQAGRNFQLQQVSYGIEVYRSMRSRGAELRGRKPAILILLDQARFQ